MVLKVRKIAAVVATGVAVVGAVLVVPSAQGAGSVASSVSMAAPASGVYGSTIMLTGRVTRSGTSTGLSGVTVYLQRSVRGQGRFGNLASTRAGSTGAFTFSVVQTSAYDYRAYYPGSATYARAFSPVRYPVTNRYVALDSVVTTSSETGALSATGRAIPAPPDGTGLVLQRYSGEAGGWINVATGRTAGGKVTISAVVRPGSSGTYRLATASLYPYGPGTSASRFLEHFVWRGAFTKAPVRTKSDGDNEMVINDQDPTFGTMHITTYEGQLGPQVLPDDLHCTKARAHSALLDKPSHSVTVYLTAGAQNRAKVLPAGFHGEVTIDVDIIGALRTKYYFQSAGAVKMSTRIELLCSN
ncbi:hypothetical protein [Kribbella deserti]|uniref:Carboxypeptidase regulatory-like domain-containing protein n=1 Tax=Kribbella deserti TaxID=1926257 RepID=A0ABV6QMX5_9ACTN